MAPLQGRHHSREAGPTAPTLRRSTLRTTELLTDCVLAALPQLHAGGGMSHALRLLEATEAEVDALLGAAAMALGPDEPPASTEPSRPVTP